MNGEGDGGRGTGPRPTNGNGAWPAPAVEPTEFRRRRNQQGTELHAAGMASSPPETASITHGGYTRGALHCDACKVRGECERFQAHQICALDVEFAQSRRQALARALQESGQDLTIHGALIERAVNIGMMIERMQRYLAVKGDVLSLHWDHDIVEEQPGAKHYLRLIAAEQNVLAELALTPSAMLKLQAAQERNRGNAAAGVLAAALARQQGLPPGNPGEPGEESVDVEFQTEDGDPGDDAR